MRINKFLILNFITIVSLAGCGSKDIYDQVPTGKEVMGIPDNITVWRDYRGIFYYVDSNGNKTHEPVKLSNNECRKRKRDDNAYIDLQCEARENWNNPRYRRKRKYQ